MSVDTIVVGGGTAGAAIAGVLAEGSSESVLLLEAGPDYGAFGRGGWPSELTDARAIPVTHDWGYDSGRSSTSRLIKFERARVIGVADNARATFEGMPGLRFKFFTLDESARRANNFYVWDSKEAALEFFSDELRERVTDLYGVAPTIEYVEIAQIVDNSGS